MKSINNQPHQFETRIEEKVYRLNSTTESIFHPLPDNMQINLINECGLQFCSAFVAFAFEAFDVGFDFVFSCTSLSLYIYCSVLILGTLVEECCVLLLWQTCALKAICRLCCGFCF